ncbi:MAG: hypothetical protein EA350_03245 [Gemmatimonadales bacterium]|nr:MAG: hypothetical protein EA350_03245 [Gemmatimonadales bacterium]
MLLLLVSVTACYRYSPLVGESPRPGEEVRLRLSGAASAELSDRVGRPIRSLEGRVLASPADSVVVDVGWGAIYAGTVFEGRRDTISFGREQLLEVDRKELSRARTTGLAAAMAVAVVAVFRALGTGRGGSGGDPGGGGPPPL